MNPEQKLDLKINVPTEETSVFLTMLETVFSTDWARDRESENRPLGNSPRDHFHAYYRCTQNGPREAAMVALYRESSATLYVSNIVPAVTSILTAAQYNRILSEFKVLVDQTGYSSALQ